MRTFSVVILGAGGVGKSALTVRFVQGMFLEEYNPTIEEEYRRVLTHEGVQYGLDILDTAGAEQFNALSEVYIKNGDGFVLVFSLIHEASLREVEDIRQQILHVKGEDSKVPIVVVGAKMDLIHEREVTRERIQELATGYKLPIYETSAKKNWHVDAVFEDLLQQMLKRYAEEHHRKKSSKKKHHHDGDHCTAM